MNVDAYLDKINCSGLKEISLENLQKIQSSQLRTFAFENLDMHLGRKITLSLEDSYDRLINRSRGGYCLHLNGIFGWALKELGYDAFFVPCFLYNTLLNKYYKLAIHAIPLVRINGNVYYVDAGTSRLINSPILIDPGLIQKTQLGVYRFKVVDGMYVLERSSNKINESDYEWTEQLKFTIDPKEFQDFEEMNEYVQTKDHPTIYYRTLVSKQFENGLRTLVGFKYAETIVSESGESRTEREVTSEEARELINEKFGVLIDESFTPVDNLNSYNNI